MAESLRNLETRLREVNEQAYWIWRGPLRNEHNELIRELEEFLDSHLKPMDPLQREHVTAVILDIFCQNHTWHECKLAGWSEENPKTITEMYARLYYLNDINMQCDGFNCHEHRHDDANYALVSKTMRESLQAAMAGLDAELRDHIIRIIFRRCMT